MKESSWVIFLKYPYATAVMACVWIGSAIMVFIDKNLPILTILIVNILFSWLISWLSFRSGKIH
jgi:hypothetical protein